MKTGGENERDGGHPADDRPRLRLDGGVVLLEVIRKIPVQVKTFIVLPNHKDEIQKNSNEWWN